jgi:Tfp pilus assembly protein PilE
MKISKLNKSEKKAILPQEVLKILIAVLCLVILIYLAVELYSLFIVKSDIEKATATVEAIAGKANALQNSQSAQYMITNLKDWSLIQIDVPLFCSDSRSVYDSCLCLCKDVEANDHGPNMDNQMNMQSCKSKGACSLVSNFEIKKDSGNVKKSILISQVPLNIYLTKENDKISLYLK